MFPVIVIDSVSCHSDGQCLQHSDGQCLQNMDGQCFLS